MLTRIINLFVFYIFLKERHDYIYCTENLLHPVVDCIPMERVDPADAKTILRAFLMGMFLCLGSIRGRKTKALSNKYSLFESSLKS